MWVSIHPSFCHFCVCPLWLYPFPSSCQNGRVCICTVTPGWVRLLSSQHKSPAAQGQKWQGKALCSSISCLCPLGTCCLSSPAPPLALQTTNKSLGLGCKRLELMTQVWPGQPPEELGPFCSLFYVSYVEWYSPLPAPIVMSAYIHCWCWCVRFLGLTWQRALSYCCATEVGQFQVCVAQSQLPCQQQHFQRAICEELNVCMGKFMKAGKTIL